MGYPGKVKFPIISNHFAKCDHEGERSAVLSAIYYLNATFQADFLLAYTAAMQKWLDEGSLVEVGGMFKNAKLVN